MSDVLAYKIVGGRPVNGEMTCLGAKNFATKALVAACLADGPTTLTNVPQMGDVDITINLLKSIGIEVEWQSDKVLKIDPTPLSTYKVKQADSRHNRIPILLIPALLHKCGKAHVPHMGGCNIGDRKVDFHIEAARMFGATVDIKADGYEAHREKRLQGVHYELPYPSVGATETCLMLAVLAQGTTVIKNAAIEPEIIELITMLRSMGAVIFTSTNREIRIEGVEALKGTHMYVLGDRIEAASWACLAAATGGSIIVHGIRPHTMGNFLSYFQQVGGGYEFLTETSIRFFREKPLTSTIIETDVYPGFSTDWQQPFAVLLTQAHGMSVVHETVYENRFGYLKTLNKLGAKTQTSTHCLGQACRFHNQGHPHSALIMGATQLQASEKPINIPDLRAGLAYVIAAAVANGTSLITNIGLLERGYGDVAKRVNSLTLDLEKVTIKDEEGAAEGFIKRLLASARGKKNGAENTAPPA